MKNIDQDIELMKVNLRKDQKIKIEGYEDVYNIMFQVLMRQSEFRRKQECFWVMGLSSACNIEYIELVSLGSLNRVNVEPIDLFGYAVESRCSSIVLVHNHPSGETQPSGQDIVFTKKTVKTAKLLGIKIQDHFIISETGFYSFAQSGMEPFDLIGS